VSNTGPLISALQCGRFDLLKQYFSRIYITASELAELERHGWAGGIRPLIDEVLLVVIGQLSPEENEESERVAKEIAALAASGDRDWHSHLPEAEAMVVMKQRPNLLIDVILLDEKAARRVAQDMGLSVTGFPGVLGRAGVDGLVTRDEIRDLLKTCQQQGTHYSDALIEVVAGRYGR
jgi:predicted nucleic acid-binding protein